MSEVIIIEVLITFCSLSRCFRGGFYAVGGIPAGGPAPGGGPAAGQERPALHLRRHRQREDAHHAGRPPGRKIYYTEIL